LSPPKTYRKVKGPQGVVFLCRGPNSDENIFVDIGKKKGEKTQKTPWGKKKGKVLKRENEGETQIGQENPSGVFSREVSQGEKKVPGRNTVQWVQQFVK